MRKILLRQSARLAPGSDGIAEGDQFRGLGVAGGGARHTASSKLDVNSTTDDHPHTDDDALPTMTETTDRGNIAAAPFGLTWNQVHLSFNEISESARAIQRLAIQGVDDDGPNGDPRDSEARFIALGALAERIGLIADRAASALGSPYVIHPMPEPERWMMPPAWWEGSD